MNNTNCDKWYEMEYSDKNNMATYIHTHSYVYTHTYDKKMENEICEEKLRKAYSFTWRRSKKRTTTKMFLKNSEGYPCPLKMPKVKWRQLVVY